MSATRDGRGTRDVPLEMRKSVASAVEAEISARYRGKSERTIAKALGISQPALNKIRRCEGALGVHALLYLREALRVSIDDLLGLAPLAPAPVAASELELAVERALARRFPAEPTMPPPPERLVPTRARKSRAD
jgi:transcriptional regulator with XRE-family HTH domain